MYQGDTRKAHK